MSILTISDLKLTGHPLHLENYAEELMIVYEHEEKRNLFNLMPELCRWHKQNVQSLNSYPTYVRLVHHIPNYIAWLNNKTNCELITKAEVDKFVLLLEECVGYYTNNSYYQCKNNFTMCGQISDRCKVQSYIQDPQNMSSIIFNTFHFLAGSSLKYNPSFLELTMSASVLQKIDNVEESLFEPLYEKQLRSISDVKFNGVKVVAYTMLGFKPYLFNSQLIGQCFFAIMAVIFVIILTWIYAGSFFIGLTTAVCILFAALLSYFVYGRIFNISFFPFININTLIFVIGIGADDVFVYTQVWQEAKQTYKIQNPNDEIKYLTEWTIFSLRHAIVAMLVTSLTTAVSFFSNMASSVTAVKCFGLYAGTVIIINYLLMVTYLPCTVIIHERYLSKYMHHCFSTFCPKHPVIQSSSQNNLASSTEDKSKFKRLEASLTNFKDAMFNDHLPKLISRLRYIFIVCFTLLGIGGILVTFVKPGLKPPNVSVYQVFSKSSPLEQYDLSYKQKFDYGSESGQIKHEIYFVFGVTAIDNGNKFDPDDLGTLEFKTLELNSLPLWIKEFCDDVRSAHFYHHSTSCSQVNTMFLTLLQPCKAAGDICCNKALPIQAEEFLYCFQVFLKIDQQHNVTGIVPVFDKSSKTLKALILPVTTIYVYTLDFEYNKKITNSLEQWTDNEMKKAPHTLVGWWIGQFDFYDLQESLYKGTNLSIGKNCYARYCFSRTLWSSQSMKKAKNVFLSA